MLKEIGQVLRIYREESTFTQEELAHQLGSKDHGYVGRIERGESAPSLKYISKWLKICNKSESKFLNDVVKEYLPE